MHLYGQVLFGIDQLDEHRHGRTAGAVGAQKAGAVGIQIFPQRLSGIRSVFQNAAAVLVAGKLPALGDLIRPAGLAELLPQAVSAPEVVFADTLQKNRFCHSLSPFSASPNCFRNSSMLPEYTFRSMCI